MPVGFFSPYSQTTSTPAEAVQSGGAVPVVLGSPAGGRCFGGGDDRSATLPAFKDNLASAGFFCACRQAPEAAAMAGRQRFSNTA
jgi:hypothetical protein